jgi:hypothetical protein
MRPKGNCAESLSNKKYKKGEMMNYNAQLYMSRHSSNLKNYYNNKMLLMEKLSPDNSTNILQRQTMTGAFQSGLDKDQNT